MSGEGDGREASETRVARNEVPRTVRAGQAREKTGSEAREPRESELRTDGGDEVEIPEVERVTGTGIPIRGNDIDTDQIIPARFMKVVTFDGLGQFSFFDLRFDEDDNEKDHPMNEERYKDANVMVVNQNFGCGSSREHAPQALMRWGIDAFIGESFAEIFAGNCLALGLPTVTADSETVAEIQDFVDENPHAELDIDIADETVTFGGKTVDVTVSEGQRKALVEGIWDTTALMKSNRSEMQKTADDLPYV